MDAIKKVLIGLAIVIVLLPFLVKVLPKPMSFERVEKGLRAAGFAVENVAPVPNPMLDATEQITMTVNGCRVDVYRYKDEGKIRKQFEFQREDPGAKIVESWGLADALGAAKPNPVKTSVARHAMFMLTVASESEDLRMRVLQAFLDL